MPLYKCKLCSFAAQFYKDFIAHSIQKHNNYLAYKICEYSTIDMPITNEVTNPIHFTENQISCSNQSKQEFLDKRKQKISSGRTFKVKTVISNQHKFSKNHENTEHFLADDNCNGDFTIITAYQGVFQYKYNLIGQNQIESLVLMPGQAFILVGKSADRHARIRFIEGIYNNAVYYSDYHLLLAKAYKQQNNKKTYILGNKKDEKNEEYVYILERSTIKVNDIKFKLNNYSKIYYLGLVKNLHESALEEIINSNDSPYSKTEYMCYHFIEKTLELCSVCYYSDNHLIHNSDIYFSFPNKNLFLEIFQKPPMLPIEMAFLMLNMNENKSILEQKIHAISSKLHIKYSSDANTYKKLIFILNYKNDLLRYPGTKIIE